MRPIDGDAVLENICLDNCGCSPDECRYGNVDECPIPNVHYITDASTVSPEKEIVAQINVRVDEDEIIKRLKEDETLRAVVRCKDCRYAHMTYAGECKYCDFWQEDGGDALYLDGDFYCAAGERKDEESNNENQH